METNIFKGMRQRREEKQIGRLADIQRSKQKNKSTNAPIRGAGDKAEKVEE